MSLLNYIKQIWDTTSYVNPTRMNHIEDGIYAVSDKVDNLSADDIPYDSSNSVKDMLDINTGTMSVKTGVDITILRSQLYKIGNLKCITICVKANANINSSTAVFEVSSGFNAISLTDIPSVASTDTTRMFYINGSDIFANGPLSTNVVYFINATYR